VIVEVFRWTPVPWFFPHRVFHVKILVLICVIVVLYLFIVWFCFYCTKREKGLGLVNCELYSAELIRLVVPSFPNRSNTCICNSFKFKYLFILVLNLCYWILFILIELFVCVYIYIYIYALLNSVQFAIVVRDKIKKQMN